MFCKFCGNELKNGDAFCQKCGKQVLNVKENNFSIARSNDIVMNTDANNSNFNSKEPRLIQCEVCRQEISSQAERCPHCGHKTKYGENLEKVKERMQTENNMQWIVVISAILGIVGILMLFMSLSAIAGDLRAHNYTYSAPFTDHELHNLYMLGFAAVMTGTSIGVDIGVMVRKKRQSK